jgi:hypothetical protein
VQEAAPALGLQIQIRNATTIGEIDAAFTILAREHADALFVAPDTFFTSRRVQFATLTARDRIPASYAVRAQEYFDWFKYEFWRFVFVQQQVEKLAVTAIEFPPMQKGASFNLDAVKAKIAAAQASIAK